MEKQNVIFDATVFTTLEGCPRKANNRFNLLWTPPTKSNSLEIGSLAHFILEHFYKAQIAGKSRNDAISIGYDAGREYIVPFSETNKYLRDTEHKGLLSTPEISQKDGNRELIGWRYVFDTMQQYFDYWRNDMSVPISAEEVRGKVIYEDAELRVYWKAKFDLIKDTNAGLISDDHKTMSQQSDTLSLNNQFKGQCIVLGSQSVIVDKIGWQKTLPPEKKFVKQGISYSVDQLEEFAQETVPFYARMLLAYTEANYWPPNYTQCQTKYGKCDYVPICQADRHMRDAMFPMMFVKGKEWDVTND